MNELERLLTADVERLIDRLAASVPPNTIGRLRTSMPQLSARIEETDQRLAETRRLLSEEYASWREQLAEIEDLWSLATWKTAVADEPLTRTAA